MVMYIMYIYRCRCSSSDRRIASSPRNLLHPWMCVLSQSWEPPKELSKHRDRYGVYGGVPQFKLVYNSHFHKYGATFWGSIHIDVVCSHGKPLFHGMIWNLVNGPDPRGSPTLHISVLVN